ncbi:hypothetical protein [Geitlerinema sp. PCC 7407]|uniref:hypothetical protein n=1 Tax=Geitlerinema sp. PCC 7407 TaxID=1173025 RepID=UPI00029FD2C7|nr:hypothetical protein [Geitlerinema sp. PCC 7407]AFY67273.1 hypothetical protein GEI7407_2800 [Geitlerinema sp. PCC 7407]
MSNLDEGVYWCARDLDGSPIGNHHFILLVCPDATVLFSGKPPVQEDTPEGMVYFYTVGAFKGSPGIPDLLKAIVNQDTDVKAVREYVDPGEHTSPLKPDLDLEPHKVNPPSGSLSSFRKLVIQLTTNFESKGNIRYSLIDENCAAWINTLFKIAGVSEADREKAGEFFGIDWGEEDLIPEEFFKS